MVSKILDWYAIKTKKPNQTKKKRRKYKWKENMPITKKKNKILRQEIQNNVSWKQKMYNKK